MFAYGEFPIFFIENKLFKYERGWVENQNTECNICGKKVIWLGIIGPENEEEQVFFSISKEVKICMLLNFTRFSSQERQKLNTHI